MQKVIEPIINNYEFIKDMNNDIVSAVYPMREHLKKENTKRTFLGGSPFIEIETGMNRFENLGIPAGLYLESRSVSYHNMDDNHKNMKKTNVCMVIEEDVFDKLLGSVSAVKPYSGTRKNRADKKLPTKNKQTKKNN
jgi:hypothetical protein